MYTRRRLYTYIYNTTGRNRGGGDLIPEEIKDYRKTSREWDA